MRKAYWGDELDRAQQRLQDSQTNGIPIGPDTSFVVGELILSACDRLVASELPESVRPYRYYDDYEFVTRTFAEAEQVLALLEQAVGAFDLRLNPKKTSIVELPTMGDAGLRWVRAFPPSTRDSEGAIVEYFQRIFDHRRANPDSTIVSYAMSRLGAERLQSLHWSVTQDLASQAVSADTSALHQYVRSLTLLKTRSQVRVDTDRLGELLEQVILAHAPRNEGHEVAWAIWAAMAFGIRFGAGIAAAVSIVQDDQVATLALEAETRGVFRGALDTAMWSSWLTGAELWAEHWFFAYEAPRRKLLQPAVDYIASDRYFAALRAHGVAFSTPFRPLTPHTARSIEDYSDRSYDGSGSSSIFGGDDDDDDDD